MKTRLLYLFAGILIAVGSIILLIVWLFNRPCGEWEKPVNVPASAVWKGGCDDGMFCRLIPVFPAYYEENDKNKMQPEYAIEISDTSSIVKEK